MIYFTNGHDGGLPWRIVPGSGVYPKSRSLPLGSRSGLDEICGSDYVGTSPAGSNRCADPGRSRPQADAPPIARTLSETSKALIVIGPDFGITTAHGELIDFTPGKPGKYVFVVECQQSRLAVWLEKLQSPLKIANDTGTRAAYRYEIATELEGGTSYALGIGIGAFRDDTLATLPIHYRVGVYSANGIRFPYDPLLQVDEISEGTSYSFDLSRRFYFASRPARYFRLRLPDKGRRWIRATVTTNTFFPDLWVFDPQKPLGEGKYWRHHGRARSTIQCTQRIDGDEAEIAVILESPASLSESGLRQANFVLRVDRSEFDPSQTPFAQLRNVLIDPVVSLFLGILVGGCLSYLFYKRSVSRRTLLYRLVSDQSVLWAGEPLKSSRLRVMRGDEPILESVGVCSVLLSFRGHRDLRADEVLEPIRLRFVGMTSILRATARGSAEWKSISIPSLSPMSVDIQIVNITPSSKLHVDIFYTQKPVATEIIVSCTGKFVDGTVQYDRGGTRSIRRSTRFIALLVFPLAPLLMVLDTWFLQLPDPLYWLVDKLTSPVVFFAAVYWVVFAWWETYTRVLSWVYRQVRRLPGHTEPASVVFEAEPGPPGLHG